MATPGQAIPGTVVTSGAATTTGGPQGAMGSTGPTGTRGSIWFNGAGPPPTPISGSLPGDYYLDTTSGDVYVVS
jgi:hypothetical protein